MNKILLSAMTAVFATVTLTANAEALKMGSTEPAIGEVEQFGSLRIYNPGVPVPNPECTTPARLYINDVLVDEIESTSTRVQRFIMQADECFTLNFSSKPYKTPGQYRVTVPEGFVTYKDTENINAAAEYEFTILPPVKIVAEPAAGFLKEMPRYVTLTFEGVAEVIDNKKKPTGNGDGAIRFDNPEGFCYPQITIEGNVMSLYFGPNEEAPEDAQVPDEEDDIAYIAKEVVSEDYMTWIGEYTLTFNANNLTFVMPDGTRRNNYLTILSWYVPAVECPTVSPAPGELDEISEFSVTLPGEGTYRMWSPIETPRVYSVDVFGTMTQVAKFVLDGASIKDQRTANFKLATPIREAGQYTVIIGKSAFWMNNPDGTSIWNGCPYDFNYEVTGRISGVNEVSAAAESYDVYTAAGLCVGRGLDSETLKSLPAGLYIVNGKKIIKH
ncbi:MAG: hypothetical protein K2H86_06325 [Muribaculaceae bacterium]|nr:hypothetical protein [Muribaculaceae bacterium]